MGSLNYLDPGTGSFIIQAVLALLLGAGVAVRIFWKRIKRFLGGKNAPPEEEEQPSGDDESEG